MLCLSVKTIRFVNHQLLTGHHNKSYDNENNNQSMQKPTQNFSWKVREEIVEAN